MALVQRVRCSVPLKSGVESHLNVSGVGATGPKSSDVIPRSRSRTAASARTI